MDIRKWLDKYSTDCRLKYSSVNTQSNYISCVSLFLHRFKEYREPKEVPNDGIKAWLLEAKTINTRKHRLCAINSFYKITVHMPAKIQKIPYPKASKSLPKVIDKKELTEKINAITNIKHRAILSLAYSVGLRVSEVCSLKITDIDSERMIIHVKHAKGDKDRLVPLSEKILTLLRDYWKEYRPKEYMFEGQGSGLYSTRSCEQIMKKYIGNDTHFHLLRHSSFTAMLEGGVDCRIIQKIAGHSNIKTTEIYTHVSRDLLNKVYTPM